MVLSRKALYNLLRLAQADGIELPGVQGWELEDHSQLDQEALFKRLLSLGIKLDPSSFAAFAASVKSPEELADVVVPDEADDELHDHAYLILFELWRRLLPDRRPHSIFCNELDELMSSWYAEDEGSNARAQGAISLLQTVLQDADDAGMDPETLFAMIAEGCGNNLAGFLYDFGRAQLEDDDGDPRLAREIVDFYQNIVPEPRWMEMLQSAILDQEGHEETASQLRHSLAAKLTEDWSLQIALELITDLMGAGELVTALQLIELGLHRAQCNQEAADILEPIVVLVNEVHADELSQLLSRAWESLVIEPLARLRPADRDPLIAMLHLLHHELSREDLGEDEQDSQL